MKDFFIYKESKKSQDKEYQRIVVYIITYVCERSLTNYIITEKKCINMLGNTTKNMLGVLHDFFDYSNYFHS